ncbi:60S ribosomal protein L22/L17e [Encephalitozoon intestinalis ATCC 50506]|uniref:60S ribosomal protein L22/L17e n=1 Tax=Encephalitozoon intestinalis (strain ATCC 50506) TaxID=876142 RepID=E0S864_ENCIT|nr:60S ribosomal protein L22/L17e [Encephalitozoon intestinalis ATCC 50506]ADM11899.1 60S ribosomal protein L22/L17e [Encephalitozoon intestinalis ATCC 50506]UTX45655.1 ribosomal protein L22/L17e [Encephalitozoon intestinalis]
MGIKYSYEIHDPSKAVKGKIDNAKVSFKKTRETCCTLRKRKLLDAIQYLKNVISKTECVPFRRYNRGCGQTHQARKFSIPRKEIVKANGEKVIKRGHVQTRGRWPKKSAEFVISLLESVKESAESKSLDVGSLVITHIQVSKAPKIFGRTFRAHGRVNPFNKSPCHIQVVAEVLESNDVSIEA